MSGFGSTTVYGRRRVPLPPARMTARLDMVHAGLVVPEVYGVPEPLDSPPKPVLESDRRYESCERSDERVIAPQALDLASGRAESCLLGFDSNVSAHDARDQFGRVANRYFRVGSDVHRATYRSLAPCEV